MKFRVSLALVLSVLVAACVQRPEPAPVTGWSAPERTTIRVERGDTVFGIAHRYNQPALLIIEVNHLVPPYRLEVGQALMLPGPEEPMPGPPAYAAAAPMPQGRWHEPPPPKLAEARIDSSEVPPSARRQPRVAGTGPANLAPPPEKPAAAVAAAQPRGAEPPERVGPRGFIWPVRGHVVEGFGAGRNGTHNDGINIAARAGSSVYAAAAGEVVYVGNQLRGYGNLVLIKHEGGYLTAYAHNSVLLVHQGEHVARGQTIARVGSTGQVGEPQLHFEIRAGRNPVNPAEFLPPVQQASIGE
jgi:murein DD-endopeptidase MepM/ murein hydrolase activator NlpD